MMIRALESSTERLGRLTVKQALKFNKEVKDAETKERD